MSTIVAPRSKAEVDEMIADLKKVTRDLLRSKKVAKAFMVKKGYLTKAGKLTKRYSG